MSIDLNMSSITNQLVQFVSEIAFFSLFIRKLSKFQCFSIRFRVMAIKFNFVWSMQVVKRVLSKQFKSNMVLQLIERFARLKIFFVVEYFI